VTDRLQKVRRIYDNNPAAYHRGMSFLTERLLARRRRKVGEMVRGRLLDVGFGTGLSLPHYPAGVEVVGIDISRKMLEYARQIADSARPRPALAVMDAARLGFPDHTFDSVAFNLSLCTIPDPAAALAEAVRVARPGAPMVFLEHVRSNLLPVALAQEALNPVLVALEEDHWNRHASEHPAEWGGGSVCRPMAPRRLQPDRGPGASTLTGLSCYRTFVRVRLSRTCVR
jgi:ubiquinone/menaquinone biosynthesis C-methylase UbiE